MSDRLFRVKLERVQVCEVLVEADTHYEAIDDAEYWARHRKFGTLDWHLDDSPVCVVATVEVHGTELPYLPMIDQQLDFIWTAAEIRDFHSWEKAERERTAQYVAAYEELERLDEERRMTEQELEQFHQDMDEIARDRQEAERELEHAH